MSELVRYPGPGCIVEYMEGNAPQIALVLEEQDGKLRLLLPNRRELRLGANRLLPWSGPALAPPQGRDAAVQVLERHRSRREEASTAINVLDVWDMAQGEMERASAQWFAELGVDTPDADTVAAYGRALLACKSHFKLHPPHFEIYAAETVQARLADQEAAQRREAFLHGGTDFFRLLWEVFCKKRRLPAPGSSEWPAPEIVERLKEIILRRVADPETHDDDMVWRSLIKGLPELQHMPLHLATAWELVPPHYNFWMAKADYTPGDAWAEQHATAVQTMLDAVAAVGEPTLTLPFISIDSATTRDVDDAYSMESLPDGGMLLVLALACPALHWPFDSPLDKAVARRATSLYLPEATHHMLPESLGTGAFSLKAGITRPALCLTCHMDAEGALLSCTPSLEQVRLAANLIYEDTEAVLEAASAGDTGDNAATPYAEQLVLGEKLALVRQAARIAAGAVIMDRPDPKITLEGEGADIAVRLEETLPTPRAQMLVAEMMILASAACVSWAQERGIALIYRTQDVAIPREYAGVWTAPHDMARIIRALVPSCLESTPRPHAGLGVPAYSPVTSPLRRYPDLINEAQIVSWLCSGAPRLDFQSLDALLLSLNMRLEAAGQVQRFRPRYWKLLYVRQQGDKCWWDGVVTEENDHFCNVALPREQLFVRGRRYLFGERACPGQRLQVRLGKVNPLYNEINLLEAAEV